uniref:Uncharacterized protein n=1 Tax=uncultured Bacteroidota bacterium TaxID=152509 RepID=H5SM93_9BACT|nr:hypothetical protein HGMM_F50B04C05 [uncultured Bacteroidetes bacterium]
MNKALYLGLAAGLLFAQVGIGTTTPTHKLDVAGEARIRTLNPLTAPFRIVGANAQGVLGELRGQNNGDLLQWDATLNQWTLAPAQANAWLLLGNAGTNPTTNFLGTLDATDLVIRTNNTERLRVLSTGEVRINTTTTAKQVHIEGGNTGGLQVTVNSTGANNLSANLFTSSLAGGGTTAHGVEVTTSGDASYLIGVGSSTSSNHAGTNVGVRGIAANTTGRAIGAWGAIGDATAFIGSVSPTFSAGTFAYNANALVPSAGVLASPTPPPAAEQAYALYARGRTLLENGQVIFSAPIYNPAAPPPLAGIPTGAGTRFLWLPERVAYRAVGIAPRADDPFAPNQTDHADPASIGYASFAAGLNVRASGTLSFVVGVASEGTATGSVALGKYVSTTHQGSFQIGDDPGPPTSRAASMLRSSMSNQFSARFYNGYRFLVREKDNAAPWSTAPFPPPDPNASPTAYPNRIPGVFIAGMYNHFRLGSIDYGIGDSWVGIGTQLPDAPLHIVSTWNNRGIIVEDGSVVTRGGGNIEVAGTGTFRAAGQNGITRVVNVMGSTGTPCQLNFVKGILVSTNCP